MREKMRMKQFTRKLIAQELDDNPTKTTDDQAEVEKSLAKFLSFSQDFPESRKKYFINNKKIKKK